MNEDEDAPITDGPGVRILNPQLVNQQPLTEERIQELDTDAEGQITLGLNMNTRLLKLLLGIARRHDMTLTDLFDWGFRLMLLADLLATVDQNYEPNYGLLIRDATGEHPIRLRKAASLEDLYDDDADA